MEILHKPEFWFILLTAASEIIGISPLKDNSIIQLILRMIKSEIPRK